MLSVGDAIRDSTTMKGKAASIAMQLKVTELMRTCDGKSAMLMRLVEEAKVLGEAETKKVSFVLPESHAVLHHLHYFSPNRAFIAPRNS